MSLEAAIEAPFTLASLPKPFDPATGRTLAAPVYGLRGQRWRKRPEIAVTVDGESVSIYNIRNPRLVTSYALPPQTRFLASPCSISRKLAGRKASQRITYAAVTDKSGKNVQLVCFTEETLTESSDLSADQQVKLTYAFEKPKRSICSIHALPSHSDNEELGSALDVCVVYEDGSVQCVAGDLSSKRWDADSFQAIALSQGAATDAPGNVEYAAVTDVATARRGLLKNREDALAVIGDASAETSTPLLVLVIGSTATTTKHFHVFALPSRSKDMVSSAHQGLRHLLSYHLPGHEGASTSSLTSNYLLQASTGKFHQLSEGVVTTYDLSGTVPRVLSQLQPRSSAYSSFVRISPALILAADPSACGLYDTKYSSVQAMLSLSSEPVDLNVTKRKTAEGLQSVSSLDFISFFADLGLAVALSGNEIVGLQINLSAPTHKKSKTNSSLLIDSLGKGMGMGKLSGAIQHDRETDASDQERLVKWKEIVDGHIAESGVTGLENFLAADLDVVTTKKTRRGRHNKEKHDGRKPAVSADVAQPDAIEDPAQAEDGKSQPPRPWALNDISSLIQKTDRRKALYVLGKMFDWVGNPSREDQSSVAVILFAPNVFKWLALTGYMSSSMIEKALRENTTAQNISVRVAPGDVMKAFNELDPALHIMHEWLSWPVPLEIEEVVSGLRALIESIEGPGPAAAGRLITSGKTDEATLNGELESTMQLESEAAEVDLDVALSALDNGLDVRSSSFHTIFTRLHSFPATDTTKVLRSLLTPSQTVFFIQVLRIELAHGGWTSRYIDAEIEQAEDGTQSNNSIDIIASLLSTAIDSIGTSGWLVGLSGDADLGTDEMLSTLKAEISAALDGCHQVCALKIYLNDFEQYSKAVQAQEKASAKKVHPVKAPGIEAASHVADPLLPLGFKVPTPIAKTMMKNGGLREQKKSKSRIGKEISMRVGKYSLDRVRV
ncbi:hypothetical protein MBLNU459_g3326t1 [Dothideomycetes sp. NU459]